MPLVTNSLRTLSAALVAAALLIATIVLGRDILIPLALAGISCFVMVPLVRWLKRQCVPDVAAVSLVIVVVTGLLLAASIALSSQLLSLAADLPAYRTNVLAKVKSVTGGPMPSGIVGRAIDAVESYQEMLERELKLGANSSAAVAPNSENKPDTKVVVVDDQNESTAWRGLRILAEPLAQAALTFLFTLFLLIQYKDLRDRLVRVFGTENMSETTAAMSEAGDRLSDLFVGQAILNASFGVFVGCVLMLVGVPNAVLWGAVAFVMRFVPFVGSYIAAVPPILLAAAVDPGWAKTICTLAVFVIGEPIMGQVLEPLFLGKRAGLSPFAMVLATSFWTLAWGPIGLVLAAPLTLILVVLGKYIPSLEFVTVLLGDEPPLSQEQDLYHRLLSGDAYGATSQIEEAEEKTPLERVLDVIVFPALKLAARDRRNGRLDADGSEELEATIDEVLSPSSDTDIATATRILFIPTRGPFDILAARFCAAALNKHEPNCASTLHASGLTAIASIDFDIEQVEQVVFVTVTGVATRLVGVMANRAAKKMPNARIVFLDLTKSPNGSQSAKDENDLPMFNVFSEFASSIIASKSSASQPGSPLGGPTAGGREQLRDDETREGLPVFENGNYGRRANR